MGMFKPRYYQADSIQALYDYFHVYTGNPIIAQPTGTGKSVVIANFLKGIYEKYPTQRIMMLTHVKELIEQNFEKLKGAWSTAPAGIYSAGLGRRDTHNKITFAGIQSVRKIPEAFGHIDLIIIDECHLVSDQEESSYYSFIEALKAVNPYLKVIGLSATPYRLGMGLLTEGKIFTDICYDNTTLEGFNRLIAEGFLMPLIPKATTYELDTEGLKKTGGEFNMKAMQKRYDQDEVTFEALKEAIEEGHNRNHWMVFGTGTEHCDNIADMLDELGIAAVSVHSKKSGEFNDQAIADFKDGKITALVNNNKLTTGFDFNGIDFIIMLRPTSSPGLWVQMLGRGTRPIFAEGFDLSTVEGRLAAIAASTKQNCLVMDFAGNTRRLGPINDPVIPRKKGTKGVGGTAPVRMCEKCKTYNHASVRICINCGYEFPKQVSIFAMAATDELIASNLPQVEEFKVTKVVYACHRKMDRPDSVKATYYCGLRKFTSYVCFEHGGNAGRRAQRWWGHHTDMDAPATTEEALTLMDKLEVPSHLRIWINKKYPEIMAYAINGEFK